MKRDLPPKPLNATSKKLYHYTNKMFRNKQISNYGILPWCTTAFLELTSKEMFLSHQGEPTFWSWDRNVTIVCFHVIAAINGNYSDWSDWSECSRTCSGGIKIRARECINPSPLYGGKDCKEIGSAFEKVHCNPQSCPGTTLELLRQRAFSNGR